VPILSKAAVSEVAANTTSWPEGFPAAAVLPAAGLFVAPPDDGVVLVDELHDASATTSAAVPAPRTILARRELRNTLPMPLPFL
jgi:hypothetical protein